MRILINLFLSFIIIAFVSCEKESIDFDAIPENQPVFHANGSLDNEVFRLYAGRNEVNSSFLIDSDNNNISTIIQNQDTSLKITLFLEEHQFEDIGQPETWERLFDIPSLNYIPEIGFEFTNIINDSIVSFDVYYNNQQISDLQLLHLLTTNGAYDICVTANFLSGCSRDLCNTVYIGVDGPDININHSIFNDSLFLETSADGDLTWYLNDYPIGNGNTAVTNVSEGIYVVSLKQEINGVTYIVNRNVSVNSSECFFEDFVVSIPNLSAFALVEYTVNGSLYESITSFSQDAFIQIDEAQPYVEPGTGRSLLRLNGHGELLLNNSTYGEKSFVLKSFSLPVLR
jgi:hypothetical protein